METFNIQLTAIAHGGAALGRYEGRVIFIPYALPGETVRAEITQDKGRYAFARLVEVLEPSPNRIPPPCPYFTICGGCQWQHADYQGQLDFKSATVADQLTRIGKIAAPHVRPTLPDDSGWAYRNHAQFHPVEGGGLGFHSAGSHEAIAIDECPIIHPLLADLYAALGPDMNLPGLSRLSLRAGTETGDLMLIFEMTDDLPPGLEIDLPVSCVLLLSDGVHVNLIGNNHITETVAGYTYRISAPSFFQVNTAQAAQLVRLVTEYLDLQGGETVLDAYCGVGLFTTHLAERAGLVIGIEQSSAAVTDLLENTAEQDALDGDTAGNANDYANEDDYANADGYGNIDVIEGPVEAVLPDLDLDLGVDGPLDAAVIDPPRAGVDRFALDALVKHHPARLVYVSCDPATLARDAKRLIKGGYELVEVQPVDMFPQTAHVESVALFVSTNE